MRITQRLVFANFGMKFRYFGHFQLCLCLKDLRKDFNAETQKTHQDPENGKTAAPKR
jgi:hypothetical protein